MDLPFDLSAYEWGGFYYRVFSVIKFEYDEIAQITDDFFLDKFNYLRYVKTFSFQGNKLKKIPERFFQNFEAIVDLDLSANQFENISDLSLTNGKFLFTYFEYCRPRGRTDSDAGWSLYK